MDIKLSFWGSTFTIPYHPLNNLPILQMTALVDCFPTYCHVNNFETHKPPEQDEAKKVTFTFPLHMLLQAQHIKMH